MQCKYIVIEDKRFVVPREEVSIRHRLPKQEKQEECHVMRFTPSNATEMPYIPAPVQLGCPVCRGYVTQLHRQLHFMPQLPFYENAKKAMLQVCGEMVKDRNHTACSMFTDVFFRDVVDG